MNYSRFKRRYILMEETNSVFSLKANLKGLARVETGRNKGFLRLGMQNLSTRDVSQFTVLLVGQEGEHSFSVKMGTLIEDNPGNFSYVGTFNPYDIDGYGHPFHGFHSLLVVATMTDGESQFVMRGHLLKKAVPIPAHILNPDPLGAPLKNYCLQMEEQISGHEKASPFEEASDPCLWWRIEEFSDCPMMNDERYLACQQLVHKYHHYLFGIPAREKQKSKMWLFGFPGRKSEESLSPDHFLWQPLKGASLSENSYGYHLCSVSPESGKISYPEML